MDYVDGGNLHESNLPGFGYAKLGKETNESAEKAAERYLSRRRDLALGVLLPCAQPLIIVVCELSLLDA